MAKAFFLWILFLLKPIFALTEQEFIQKVLNQDTHFEKDQIYVVIKKIELEASRDAYAGWRSNLSATLHNAHYDINKKTVSKKTYDKKHINTQSIRLASEKRFLSNPSSLKISATRRYKQTDSYDDNVSAFDDTYKISYKYPLLKHDSNAGSFKTYRRNILDLEREKLDFDDAQEAFLVKRLKQYLDWGLYSENTDIYQQYLQTIQKIKAAPKDKKKLNTAIFLAQKDISDNNAKLQAQKKGLSIVLNDEALLLQKPRINYHKQAALITTPLGQYLQKNVRSLLKYQIDKKLKKTDLNHYENQSLFKLDLTLGAEKDTNKRNTLKTKYGNSSMFYFAGLTFNMPIGIDINNEKEILTTKLELRKFDIDYANKFKDIKSDIGALNVELSLNEKTLNDYKGIIRDLTDNANLAHDNYANQKVSIKDLLDIYKEKRDVELEYVTSVINYQKNILEYNDKLDKVIKTERTLP